MKISELKEKRIVTKDGHFMPLVFVDIAIPAAYAGVALVQGGRELDKQIKDNKHKFSHLNVFNNRVYTPINYGEAEVASLTMSIDDIKY
ncbi:MAG: hypothetical protein ACI35Y_06545 [Candidatus Limimorpha sp.]